MKVLLAIDGSSCSWAAVNEVAKHAWPTPTTIKVISVVEPFVVPVPEAVIMPEGCYDVLETSAHADVDRAIQLIRSATPGLEFESKVCLGKAEEIILDEAENWNADLIVVGSHGRSMTGRLLLGSVSQAVALHAKCSVEIVRCSERNGYHRAATARVPGITDRGKHARVQ